MKYFLGLLSLALVASFAIGGYTPNQQGIPGVVFEFAGTSCPAHSVAADGTSRLRAGTYANLFAAIGANYGAADGTHFNAPDLRGKFVRGVLGSGTGSNDPDANSRTTCATGGASGNAVGSCQVDQFKSHNHQQLGSTVYVNGGGVGAANTGNSSNQGFTANTGGNQTNPINVYVLYCIWY